jgi:uncharacterized protein involved in exopolysaccharide biosynthesis
MCSIIYVLISNYLYTQGELIRSAPIINEVAGNSQITNMMTFSDVDNVAGYLKKYLKVAVGKRDDIITVSFDCPYPQEAALLVNTVVDSYVNYHSLRQRSTVSEVLKILQKEKVKRDQELSDKFAELVSFTRENGVISFDNNSGNIVFERLNKLAVALTEAQLATLNARADFEAVESMASNPEKIRQFAGASAGSGAQVFDSERQTQLLSELRRAELELENTRYYCTEDHPSVQAIHSEIKRIKTELDEQSIQFSQAYIEVMKLRCVSAKQREIELESSFNDQHQAAQELGVKAAEYAVLQSELKRTERLCEILDNRIKELNVTEDTGALNISILEAARPARSPSRPQKARILAMAMALGLAFGVCLSIIRDWMDYRLRSSEEISELLGIPVLGEVPAMSDGRGIAANRPQQIWHKLKSIFLGKYRQAQLTIAGSALRTGATLKRQSLMIQAKTYRARRAADGAKLQTVVGIPPAAAAKVKTSPEIQPYIERGQIVRLKPRSIVAEAYRTIRTSVFFGVPKGGARTILVTSPAPGDGKTTLASNLAIAMAQAGQRTILIDADLRKPKQHKIFEISRQPGLTSVTAGVVKLDDIIQPGSVERLDILPCGPEALNP